MPPLLVNDESFQQHKRGAHSQAVPPANVLACVAAETNTAIAKRRGLDGMTGGK
jgi:hypothetical protein